MDYQTNIQKRIHKLQDTEIARDKKKKEEDTEIKRYR